MHSSSPAKKRKTGPAAKAAPSSSGQKRGRAAAPSRPTVTALDNSKRKRQAPAVSNLCMLRLLPVLGMDSVIHSQLTLLLITCTARFALMVRVCLTCLEHHYLAQSYHGQKSLNRPSQTIKAHMCYLSPFKYIPFTFTIPCMPIQEGCTKQ